MKKSIFKKLGGLFLGLAMGLGVAVGVTAGNKASEVMAVGKTDVIDNSATKTKLSGTATSAWVTAFDLTCSSGASYKIYSMGTKGGTHALQWNKNGYLYQTKTSSDNVEIVSVTAITNSKKISIYGSNTAFTTNDGGTSIGDVSGTKTLDCSGKGYKYIRAAGTTSSTQVTSITVTYKEVVSEFTVSFNLKGHGNAIDSQKIESGKTVTKPNDPSATGYTFGGWYKEDSLTTPWNFTSDTVSANTTLYAKWTANTYNVTYKVDGAQYSSGSYTYGTGLATLASAPTKTGYNFDGWYNGNTKVTTISSTQTGAITLEARYSLINYKINYELDGGTNNDNNPSTYTIKDSVTLASPTKDGCQFKGWFLDENFTQEFESIEVGSTGEVTVYAKFEAVEGAYIKSISDIEGKVDSLERTASVSLGASLTVGGEGQIDTNILWSVSPTTAGSFNKTETTNGETTSFTASNALNENVTITATSKIDENVSTSFTFDVVNPEDEKITSVSFNVGAGADLSYWSDDVDLKLTGISLDVIYTSTVRPNFSRSDTIAATSANVMLDLANSRLLTKGFEDVETQTYPITVQESVLTSAKAVSPTTQYFITNGITPNFTAPKVTGDFSSGKKDVELIGVTFDGYNLSVARNQTVNVYLNGKKICDYNIEVYRKTASDNKTITLQHSETTTTNMDGTNQATIFGVTDNSLSVVGTKDPNASGTVNNVGLNKDGTIRLYKNSTCILTISTVNENAQIKSLIVTTGTTVGKLTVNGNNVEVSASEDIEIDDLNSASISLSNPDANTQTWITKIQVIYNDGSEQTYQDMDNLQEGDLTISASPATVYEGKTSTISFSYPSEVKENVELFNGADKVTVTEGTAQEGKKVYNYTFTAPEVAEDTQYTFTAKGVKSGEENSVVVTVKNHVANKVTISLNKNSSTGEDYPTAFYMNSGTTVGSQGVIHSKYFNVQFFDALDDNYKMFDSLENGKGYKLYAYHLDQSGSEETTPVIMDASTNVYSSGALTSQNTFSFGTYHVYATTTDGLVKSTEYVTITYSDNEYIAEGVKFSEGRAPLETVYAYKDSISKVFSNARVDWPLIIGSKYGYISEDFSNVEIKKGGQVISPTQNTILNNEDAGEYTYTIWRTPADKIGTEEGSHHDIYITGSFEVIALDSIEASDAGTGDYPYESGSFSMSASIYCMWADATDATITASDDMYAYFTVAPESYTPSTSGEAPYTQTINVSLTDDPSICDSYNVSSYKITSSELVLTNVQTRFKIGEAFNSNNLKIEIKYDSNHETKTVTSGFTVDSSAFDNTKLGFYTIKVTYGASQLEYQVRVSFIGADGSKIDVGNHVEEHDEPTGNTETKHFEWTAVKNNSDPIYQNRNTSNEFTATLEGSDFDINYKSSKYFQFDGTNIAHGIGANAADQYAQFTTDGNENKISSITVNCASNNKSGNAKLEIIQNGAVIQSKQSTSGSSFSELTATFDNPITGDVTIKISNTGNYIIKIKDLDITYLKETTEHIPEENHAYTPEQQANIMKTFLSEFKTCESGWNSRKDVEYLVEEYNAMIDDSKKKFDELTMSDYDWHDVETYNVTTHEYGEGSAKVDGILAIDKLKDMVDYYNKSKVSGETTLTLKTSTGDFTTGSNRINPILALNEVDSSVWVISVVALVGLTAIGGYFFYRKRKEI